MNVSIDHTFALQFRLTFESLSAGIVQVLVNPSSLPGVSVLDLLQKL